MQIAARGVITPSWDSTWARRQCEPLGQFPWNVPLAVHARQRSTMPQRLSGPADVVLPGEEQVTSGAQIIFMPLPYVLADLHEGR